MEIKEVVIFKKKKKISANGKKKKKQQQNQPARKEVAEAVFSEINIVQSPLAGGVIGHLQ